VGTERTIESERTRAASLTLAVAARMLERALDELTLPQFRVLSLIASSPERAGRIATLTGVSRPSLTGLLDGLVQHDFVRRVTVDGDRRGVSLEITDAGRAALERAQRSTAARLDIVLDEVGPRDRRAVLDGLAALGRAFEADGARRRADGSQPSPPTEPAATLRRRPAAEAQR
jgi:DNA-binding MarR family transcriptional regulator